ncbi:SRPBCC family protein [Gordonia desulfuricans]|uniref:SRPBCC family protein n=1 Tax=Gordonia desulfuricans TaxID=89051 RepID=A0A7K3LUE4_9ACTN|nr:MULTISPECIES: SRPBCC family protein [Gordonia]EMP12490.1 polyketide cyclase [Gordonia sp. NB41Y]NDK91799.1 SRPBCC family protein [Gordonia desulfuricans]WLP92635.1 SRPBCC family protein [Gordonia sp. NB41Y]
MGEISASQSIQIAAAPDVVTGALADYTEVRPAILPEQYHDYKVLEGGTGDGTVVHWILQATKSRQRDVKASVSVAGSTITERDANSTMVTTFTVTPAGGGSAVTATTTWTSNASGIGGFFEKTFAPKGLGRIQAALLANLKTRLEK